ncbi:hypothetical protein [Cellulosimicrobium sp. NPDC057127]|uniref:hypothetical protein n=1 Tax=Cellulosimicrobium sp. NPDC057127 TaxID=3346026 RepID=UPI003638469A
MTAAADRSPSTPLETATEAATAQLRVQFPDATERKVRHAARMTARAVLATARTTDPAEVRHGKP